MRQVIYMMQFQGAAAPVDGEPGSFRVRATGRSCNCFSTVDERGVHCELTTVTGQSAVLESTVQMRDDGHFLESGTITFGEHGHMLRFHTFLPGRLGPSVIADTQAGAVVWQVAGGEGQFEGATGLITANFTLTGDGQVTDYQTGVLSVKG